MPNVRRRIAVVAFATLLLAFAWHSATHSVDFPVYHQAARSVLQGNFELYPAAVYNGAEVPTHGFRYAPAVALLFVPFGLLPLAPAAFAFFLLKVAAFVYIGTVVARHVGASGRARSLMLLSLLVVGGYVVEEFRYGNFHFFTVALMLLAFDSAERGRIATPAAALAVAIATKITPLLLLGYFLLWRRFALCAATGGVLVALWLLPVPFVGFEANQRLVRGFATYAVQKVDERGNYSLRGMLIRHFTADGAVAGAPRVTVAALSDDAVTVTWLACTAVLGVILLATLWRQHPSPAIHMLELSLLITAMLLMSPHTQRVHLVALYVPVLALLAIWSAESRSRVRRAALAGLIITGAVSTFLPLLMGSRRLALAYEAMSPYFFATLALFVVLIIAMKPGVKAGVRS